MKTDVAPLDVKLILEAALIDLARNGCTEVAGRIVAVKHVVANLIAATKVVARNPVEKSEEDGYECASVEKREMARLRAALAAIKDTP